MLIVCATLPANFSTHSIVPKVQSLPWNEVGWRAFVEELHTKRRDPTLASISKSIVAVIGDMTKRYARKAAVITVHARYPYGSHRPANTIVATPVLEFCINKGGLRCFAVALDRVLDSKQMTENYINHTLIPFLPQLRTIAINHHYALSSEPFTYAFRTILRAWAEKVLGPRPSQANAQAIVASMRQWTCSCEPCASVRRFLTAQAERHKTLDRIGAPKRKHVEQQLTLYARGATTYQTTTGSPQGLQVSVTPRAGLHEKLD